MLSLRELQKEWICKAESEDPEAFSVAGEQELTSLFIKDLYDSMVELHDKLDKIKKMVDEQAKTELLWAPAPYMSISETLIQGELKKLHALIEE